MKDRTIRTLKKYTFGVLVCSILLSGCGKQSESTSENPLGEILAIAREEGSGTKTQFEESLGILEVNADLVAESTSDVISAVEKTPNAIGYAASGAVQDASVKVLPVDGVEPSLENISKGKYPLSRDYSLVYSGELSEVETDFLKYIETAGQTVVEEYCIPIGKEQTFLSSQALGTISICGSSSMEGVIQALVEGYMSVNKNAQITVEITDSGDGIQKAMQGGCDLGMTSRALKSYEAELLESFVVGRDGIAVVVNEENIIENITMKQLKSIYTEDASNWGEIN